MVEDTQDTLDPVAVLRWLHDQETAGNIGKLTMNDLTRELAKKIAKREQIKV